MLFSLLIAAASAASPVREFSVGISGSGESILQGGLVEFYPKLSGSFSGEGTLSAATVWPLELSLEVGYRRVSGIATDDADSWIWYVPASLLVSGRMDMGSVSVLGGLGPSMVAWQEKSSTANENGRKDWGVRWGALTEVSVRWHTPYLRPSLRAPEEGPRGLDLFVAFGARFSHVSDAAVAACTDGGDCGFDWSAIRLGGGVLVRF